MNSNSLDKQMNGSRIYNPNMNFGCWLLLTSISLADGNGRWSKTFVLNYVQTLVKFRCLMKNVGFILMTLIKLYYIYSIYYSMKLFHKKLILNNITKISFQMEIKKNESAIMFEKNERMRLETAVTSTTSSLLDMEDR